MDSRTPVDRLRVASDRVVALVAGREVEELDDRELLTLVSEITAARNALDVLAACAARVIDARSVRERGATGLAQRQGHRNATDLLQMLTGRSRREVSRAVKTGDDLLPSLRSSIAPDGGGPAVTPGVVPENAGEEWLDRMMRIARWGCSSRGARRGRAPGVLRGVRRGAQPQGRASRGTRREFCPEVRGWRGGPRGAATGSRLQGDAPRVLP